MSFKEKSGWCYLRKLHVLLNFHQSIIVSLSFWLKPKLNSALIQVTTSKALFILVHIFEKENIFHSLDIIYQSSSWAVGLSVVVNIMLTWSYGPSETNREEGINADICINQRHIQIGSCRHNLDAQAFLPLFRWLTPKFQGLDNIKLNFPQTDPRLWRIHHTWWLMMPILK